MPSIIIIIITDESTRYTFPFAPDQLHLNSINLCLQTVVCNAILSLNMALRLLLHETSYSGVKYLLTEHTILFSNLAPSAQVHIACNGLLMFTFVWSHGSTFIDCNVCFISSDFDAHKLSHVDVGVIWSLVACQIRAFWLEFNKLEISLFFVLDF